MFYKCINYSSSQTRNCKIIACINFQYFIKIENPLLNCKFSTASQNFQQRTKTFCINENVVSTAASNTARVLNFTKGSF